MPRHSYSQRESSSRRRRRSLSPVRHKRDHYDQKTTSRRKEEAINSRHSSSNRHSEERQSDNRRSSSFDDKRSYEDEFRYNERREQLPPNINVVLRNLPDRAREIDIQSKLSHMGASIDDVSLIKDRETGESRKFAFVRFTSVGHAIQFVEKYRTFDMHSYNVRVDYCKRNNQGDDREEWRCTKCGHFNPISRRTCTECRQSYMTASAEKRTYDTETIEINDGTKDISTAPSTMILLRQLDHLSTEESIYSAVQSLEGIHRAILIRDKLTKMSCEFAFVEFTTVKYAAMALEYARELLEVDGRKVLVSFASQESFIPVYGQSEWSIPARDEMDGLLAYWDKSSYASEFSYAIEQEKKQREEELRKAKEEEARKAQLAKENLQDDLSAFYADMDDFGTDNDNDIFTLPKMR
ncbi:uncharacterized protein B0P05DRAFT_533035 [Gilbertella persicaria]|uniref:uncharacterized protein n=1 Tax=Gilbertella persicaria TaxID=101096 RepID=UPI0022208BDA|nr:uncharacterized protein B0P05DRAFT_533035 [Gilbertella persicaria]KAI8086942.1 hypothetical protein B0P05DRAFT_533035 [Gilbertella persicaria]